MKRYDLFRSFIKKFLTNIKFKNKTEYRDINHQPYCCTSFAEWAHNPNDSGFSVINALINNKICFVLQCKTTDNILENGGILFEQVIKFCPFCGASLNRLIEKNKVFFCKKSEQDKKYKIENIIEKSKIRFNEKFKQEK